LMRKTFLTLAVLGGVGMLGPGAVPATAQLQIEFNKPIVTAVESGDADKVKLLLLRGDSPNQPDKRGWPILITATSLGYVDVATVLLKAGALTEVVDEFGNT